LYDIFFLRCREWDIVFSAFQVDGDNKVLTFLDSKFVYLVAPGHEANFLRILALPSDDTQMTFWSDESFLEHGSINLIDFAEMFSTRPI
jgi:hypothetical protein